jgi:hypothetical protein
MRKHGFDFEIIKHAINELEYIKTIVHFEREH